MRFKVKPEDFRVEELARLPMAPEGNYAVYRVEKQDVTTLQVQTAIAAQLNRRASDVTTPALKDKKSVAIQYLCIRGTGPSELEGRGFHAHFVGRSLRPLQPADLIGNRFTLILRDLSTGEASGVGERLDQVARYGLPNYFDEQRFGSYCPEPDTTDHFIGKTILRRDAAGAVRAYLAGPFIGDPRRVRKFKAVSRQHWGEWAYLLDKAPRPSNYRSVLTYLKDHPEGFRKALNLIPRRLLSLYLVAYQSYLWNQIAGGYLAHVLPAEPPTLTLTVLDLTLPAYHTLSSVQLAALSVIRVHLPGHRAVYADPILADVVQQVLATEDLALNDLKARILQRAYLPKGQRPLLLFPADVVSHEIGEDDQFAGRQAARVSFTLPSGAFASLVLKRLSLPDNDQLTPRSGPSFQAPVTAPEESETRSGGLPRK